MRIPADELRVGMWVRSVRVRRPLLHVAEIQSEEWNGRRMVSVFSKERTQGFRYVEGDVWEAEVVADSNDLRDDLLAVEEKWR
jgi:hypothetical protein